MHKITATLAALSVLAGAVFAGTVEAPELARPTRSAAEAVAQL